MGNPSSSIQIKRSVEIWVWIFAIAALIFWICALASDFYSFLPMALGAMIATAICWPRKGARSFQLTDEGIVLDDGSKLLPWSDLSRVTYNGQCVSPELVPQDREGRVVAFFGRKQLALAKKDELSSGKLYSYLWDIALGDLADSLHSQPMISHRDQELEKHGEDLVVTSGLGSAHQGRVAQNIRVRGVVLLAMLVFFVSSILASIETNTTVGLPFAIMSGFLLLILSLIWCANTFGKSKTKNGELVISPGGLALSSPKLKGVMKWNEVRKMSLKPSPQKPLALSISVDGAEIVINDDFQYPAWFLLSMCQKMALIGRASVQEATGKTDDIPEAEILNPYQPPRLR